MKSLVYILLLLTAILAITCQSDSKKLSETEKDSAEVALGYDTIETSIGPLVLPPPFDTESTTTKSKVIERPDSLTLVAPEGFTVSKFASDLDNPRWTYVAPNGDIFVSESNTSHSADRITLFRDSDGDGKYEQKETFLENLNQPFGMLIIQDKFYVANTDGLYSYPYNGEQTSLKGVEGEKIVDLPAGGYNNHWTRNIITNSSANKIYISVGSSSNIAEHGMDAEKRRANILEVDPDGRNEEIFASGLRNPVGMDWNPISGELWVAVNERDELGDQLVPDYTTHVEKGGFYGWPYSYYGQHKDPRMQGKGMELVEKAIVPDVPLGAHTASLGLTFYDGKKFPSKFQEGAFIGQHGSWNRSNIVGYKVVFIPFQGGKPSAKPEDFLTGFVADREKAEVYGRPVCVSVTPAGDLLVNDDEGNVIWQVSYTGSE